MLPRILRVTRAKNTKNAANHKEGYSSRNAESLKHPSNIPPEVHSLRGRAHKLLGRAGAAKSKAIGVQHESSIQRGEDDANPPELFAFEGFRASSRQGTGNLGTTQRKHNRPSKRSRTFRTQGKKKRNL